ncbi:TetR/AcrR family transcriptional regulator [Microbacterium sp. NPDC087591]|jgi:AcrR family transcriptional regulator|uniref:TetR/AcrR family transcriptional regulator n=1 Tax=Microbacterium sp. NPDC087591 TaxID=3364192 RepID=UPI0038197675
MSDEMTARSRRGRPTAGESTARRAFVLDATFAELVDHGYQNLTMTAVARRAGASKETLYSWFGNKQGLIAALVHDQAADTEARLIEVLDESADVREVLTHFATRLLVLLTGDRSVALNRAAMTDPELASLLLREGRHRTGLLVEHYLAQAHARGELRAPRPDESFELLYGLIVRDTQIRVLLGEPAPPRDALERRAVAAVRQFLAVAP